RHDLLFLRRDVVVRTDEERPLRRRPAHDLFRARVDVFIGEALLQLAPDVDPLYQGAGLVEAGPSRCERGVEVQMTVDERRRHEAAFGVELALALDRELGAD